MLCSLCQAAQAYLKRTSSPPAGAHRKRSHLPWCHQRMARFLPLANGIAARQTIQLMCSHYQGIQGRERFERHFGTALPEDAGQADVWPGYRALFIRNTPAGAPPTAPRWQALTGLFGLVPHWSTDLRMTRHTYNARSETAFEKPSFRDAWRRSQHCIIAAEA